MIKAQLYLIASSLQSKAPLPHDTPMSSMTNNDRADFIHDVSASEFQDCLDVSESDKRQILVLSYRFSQTEEGKTSIRSREFMRYVSYLLCSISINEPLRVGSYAFHVSFMLESHIRLTYGIQVMENASKQLFGELERKLV